MSAQNAAQNAATNIQVLTAKVEELEAKNAELLPLKEEMKKLKDELKSSKEMNNQMQMVCAYMTRVATDGTKKRGKGLAGVYELAEKSVQGCLQANMLLLWQRQCGQL